MARKVVAPVAAPSDTVEATNDANDTRKRQITYDWNGEQRILTQLRDKKPVATFPWSELNDEIVGRLAVHGLRQKLADSHAGKIPDAESLAREVWDNLIAGNWYGARGEGAERTTLFLEAYVRVRNAEGANITLEQFRTAVNDIEAGDDDRKKQLLKDARSDMRIVRAMNEIREERARARIGDKQPVSLDSLL